MNYLKSLLIAWELSEGREKMRITQSMMQNNMLRHLFQSQGQMDTYLTQMNTGKKNQLPSDDPFLAMKGIDYRSRISAMEQYEKHISVTRTGLETTDDVLETAVKVIGRLEDLAVQAGNGTRNPEELKAIAVEVKQLKLQLVDLANTQMNDTFIFNNTNEKALTVDPNGRIQFHYAQDTSPTEIEVSKGIYFPLHSDGNKIFNETLFAGIDTLIDGLESNDSDKIHASMTQLQQGFNQFVNEQAEIGARMNRLELTEKRMEQQLFTTKDVMMKGEGVNVEEVITNLLTQEIVQQATLAASARMIQPTLLDFLR
jgi:flagellar hook-associated protein 3 FlgL